MKKIIAGAAGAGAIIAVGAVAGCSGGTTTIREVPAAATPSAHAAPTVTKTVPAPAAPVTAPPAAGLSYCGSPAAQGGITVSAHVSCPFAENVESAWGSSGDASAVTAYSPATGLDYTMSCAPSGASYEVCSGAENTYVEFPATAASAPAPPSGQFGDVSALSDSVTSEQQAALAAAPADDYDSSDSAPVTVELTPLGDNTYSATATDSDGDSGSGDTITVSADGSSWSDTGMNWTGPDVYVNGGATSYWTTPGVSGYR